MKRKAIIIGHTGQDGHYLFELLLSKGFDVLGVSGTSVDSNALHSVHLGDLSDPAYCNKLISEFEPEHLYYLAAVHQSSSEVSFDDLPFFQSTLKVNAENYMNLLNAVYLSKTNTRCFFASSSHVFAGTESQIQNETTPYCPVSIYGVSKVLGMNIADLYRQKGVFCANGILYNHESPRRASKFVSRKIVETAVAIKEGRASELVLGDLDATIDWGYAPDYMNAAYLILEKGKPENYVVSSGKLHQVRDFVESVFELLGLDWQNFVRENKSILLKKSTTVLQGDNSKLVDETGWSASVDFKGMIKILVDAELSKARI